MAAETGSTVSGSLGSSRRSVRYVKNGARGQWWQAAKAKGQVHAGWSNISAKSLRSHDFALISEMIKEKFGGRRGAAADLNALRCLLDSPSQHIWITFEDDCLWWCNSPR